MIILQDIYKHIPPTKISFEDFRQKVITKERYLIDREFYKERPDTSIKDYLLQNERCKESKVDEYLERIYDFFFVNGSTEYFLKYWFEDNVKIDSIKKYLFYKVKNSFVGRDKIDGRYNIKYSRLAKNLNLFDFYGTTKYDKETGRPFIDLLKRINDMYYIPEFFTPSVLDIIFRKDYGTLMAYMRGSTSTPSIFNPHTFSFILTYILKGQKLFTPVLAWNAYQHAFYNTNYDEYVGTDVIPNLVNNSNQLHELYNKNIFAQEKSVKVFNCPSEKLDERYGFSEKYKEHFDTILFSPPYYNLEIYPGDEQSIALYRDYDTWLKEYWEKTLQVCHNVLQKDGKFSFVISNYRNKKTQKHFNVSDDMKKIALKYFKEYQTYKISWINFETKNIEKNKEGNFENLFIFKK
jgi:hypothetical protein